MQKLLLGATLALIGLALGGCGSVSPFNLQTSSLSASDPTPEREVDVASPEPGRRSTIEEADLGEPSPRRAPVPRRRMTTRSTQTPPDVRPPQASVEQEVTGAERPGSAPPADSSSMEEQRRRKQAEEDRNLSKLDQ